MDARIILQQRLDQIARSVPEFSIVRDQDPVAWESPGELVVGVQCSREVWQALAETTKSLPAVEASVELEEGLLGVALADGSSALLRHQDPNAPASAPAPLPVAPEQQAARFWFSLIRLEPHLQAGRPFSAHGCLESARISLLDLYRTALASGSPGAGWAGLEQLPGAGALAPLGEWLVCPLEMQAQWRCGVRLAQTYERLTLGMFERLELPYPWRLRNLAFAGLDRARPSARGAGVPDQVPVEPVADPVRGPVRFRVKGSSIRPK